MNFPVCEREPTEDNRYLKPLLLEMLSCCNRPSQLSQLSMVCDQKNALNRLLGRELFAGTCLKVFCDCRWCGSYLQSQLRLFSQSYRTKVRSYMHSING